MQPESGWNLYKTAATALWILVDFYMHCVGSLLIFGQRDGCDRIDCIVSLGRIHIAHRGMACLYVDIHLFNRCLYLRAVIYHANESAKANQ